VFGSMSKTVTCCRFETMINSAAKSSKLAFETKSSHWNCSQAPTGLGYLIAHRKAPDTLVPSSYPVA
jgi:hypothetical protein